MSRPTLKGQVWGEPTRGLTRARHRVLRAIVDWIDVHGWAPTIREVATLLKLAAPHGVQDHLERLRRDGLIKWGRGARMIAVLPAGLKALRGFETGRECNNEARALE